MANEIKSSISNFGKVFSGFLLILFTIIPLVSIIALWPDTVPTSESRIKPLYSCKPFAVKLACCEEEGTIPDTIVTVTEKKITNPVGVITTTYDTVRKLSNVEKFKINCKPCAGNKSEKGLMHLNTLLLILVAIGGFLGNMVHISTSFTTFVGMNRLERSWLLWYFVKPFTASALATILYLVFRGGFLTGSNSGSDINLFGLMTVAILAGLFTDRATQKLKEVFEVAFKVNEDRSGKLEGDKAGVKDVAVQNLEKGKEATITIKGTGFSKNTILTINGATINNAVITADTITIMYTVPEAYDKDEIILEVKPDNGGAPAAFNLKLDGNGEITGPGDIVPDEQDIEDNEDIINE